MERISALYDKAKESLQLINSNHASKGLQLLKEANKEIKALHHDHPHLMSEINRVEVIVLNNIACAYNK